MRLAVTGYAFNTISYPIYGLNQNIRIYRYKLKNATIFYRMSVYTDIKREKNTTYGSISWKNAILGCQQTHKSHIVHDIGYDIVVALRRRMHIGVPTNAFSHREIRCRIRYRGEYRVFFYDIVFCFLRHRSTISYPIL